MATKKADKIVKDSRAQASDAEAESDESAGDKIFLAEYFANGGNAVQAELSIHPKKTYNAAASFASQRLKRIRAKTTWVEMLVEAGLDDVGLIAKARQLRDAKAVLVDSYGQEHIVEDNKTQLGVMQTMGRWAGKDKLDISLDASLTIQHTFDPEGL